jgi:lysozyme
MLTPELIASTKQHEGLRLKAYKDSLGFLTIGYGHRMLKNEYTEITLEKATSLLLSDLAEAEADFNYLFPCGRYFTPARRDALIEMIFQLGAAGLRHFKKALAHIDQAEWSPAVADFLDSLWARQTPARAKELCRKLEVG